jgi:hypothetical protein
VLRDTAWDTLWHAHGCAETIPAALRALLDPRPEVRARVMDQDLAPPRREASVYPAAPLELPNRLRLSGR